jgi:cobalt/nickel transport system permease protein
LLDPYHERASLVHHADARLKLPLALAFILTVALMPAGAWPGYLLLYALLLSAEILSELGVGFYLRRALLALPFVLAAVPLAFTAGPPHLAEWPTALGTLSLSLPGLERLASIALKSWLSVQAAVLLATTTRFNDLLVAMRALRLPRILVAVVGLMWRYLFVLVDEAFRLVRARLARSGQAEGAAGRAGGSLAWRAGVTGGMAGSLFLRGFERGDRIYQAMLARGYDGEVRSLPVPPLKSSQFIILAGLILLDGLILLLAFSFWSGA